MTVYVDDTRAAVEHWLVLLEDLLVSQIESDLRIALGLSFLEERSSW